ncbi:mitosis inhibitor protein kinase swe1, partial [Coemansia thaxteri]
TSWAESPPDFGRRTEAPWEESPSDVAQRPRASSRVDSSALETPSAARMCAPRTTQRRLGFTPADIAAAAASVASANAPASAPPSGGATMFTPAATKLVRPDPAAFMSTGLQSRKQHVRTRSSGAQVAPETPCKAGTDADPFRLGKHRAASPGSLRRTRKRAHVAAARDSCDDLRSLLDTPSRPRLNTLVDDEAPLRPPPGFRIPLGGGSGSGGDAWAGDAWAGSDACSDATVAACDAMDLDELSAGSASGSASGLVRPQMPQIVQGCATNYAHFLGHAYFKQAARTLPFLAPSRDFLVDGLGYLDYFTQQFDVLARVGEGEFSTVFSARSLDDGRLYAVKRARRAFAGRQERARRLREVELLWAVPPGAGVVRLVAAWEQLGLLHMQFDLCEHGSLAAWLDSRAAAGDDRLSEPLAWAVLAHAAASLDRLHERGIAHLDVKPANFLLGARFTEPGAERDDGWLQLADFGHAVRVPPPRDAWVDEGDREYMAPELLHGVYSTAADVFSLGMMMLEIVADVVLPANGPDWHSLRVARFDDPAFLHLPYSPLLLDTIKRMLEPDHARRVPLPDVLATARAAMDAASDVDDDDVFGDDDDDFLASVAAPPARRHPLLRAVTAGASVSAGLLLGSAASSAASSPAMAVPRPASAGPGLARRTASAPGSAPASAAAR